MITALIEVLDRIAKHRRLGISSLNCRRSQQNLIRRRQQARQGAGTQDADQRETTSSWEVSGFRWNLLTIKRFLDWLLSTTAYRWWRPIRDSRLRSSATCILSRKITAGRPKLKKTATDGQRHYRRSHKNRVIVVMAGIKCIQTVF